jgi:hypothetical protein
VNKNYIPFAGIAVLLVLFVSCTKVINVDLNDVAKKYVIEGNITNEAGPYTVKITQTKNFDENNQFPGVSGATVTVGDNTGYIETLQEVSAGIYQTKNLHGTIGRTYNLTVDINGSRFTASSTMPAQVNLDSLYVTNLNFFGKIVKAVVPVYTDPAGQGNSYHFNQYINGTLDKQVYYQNDDFTDGKTSTESLLRNDPDSTLHTGDNVVVEMQCIDKPMYTYWFSLDMSATGEGYGTPSNPVTNISGGALGYFSAHTAQRKSLKVP